jgi:hypothetical protein
VYNSPAWSFFFVGMSLMNAVYVATVPEYQYNLILANSQNGIRMPTDSSDILMYFDFLCLSVSFVEVLIGSIAIGFVREKTCWLRCSEYHGLEFVILLCTITEYFAAWKGVQGQTLRPFRLLRVLRSITQIRTFAGVKAMITTLKQVFELN